jgi:hypothetical protein
VTLATLLGHLARAPATWDLLWTGPLRLLLCPGIHLGRGKGGFYQGKMIFSMVFAMVFHGKNSFSPADIWIVANEH